MAHAQPASFPARRGSARPRAATPGGCSRADVPRPRRFVVYATWAAFQGAHYEFGPYLSPFYSPLLFGTSPHAWFGGPQPAWWPACAALLAGAADPLGAGRLPLHLLLLSRRVLQGVLGRSARLRRRRAAQEVPGRALVPADPPEHPPLLPVPRLVFLFILAVRRVEGDVVSGARRRAHDFGIGVGTLVLPPTSCCSAATRSAATRCGTWSAACST